MKEEQRMANPIFSSVYYVSGSSNGSAADGPRQVCFAGRAGLTVASLLEVALSG